MNWTTILTNEARSNCVLRLEELSRKYKRSEPVARNSLRRYEQKGLVERGTGEFGRSPGCAKQIVCTSSAGLRHGTHFMLTRVTAH